MAAAAVSFGGYYTPTLQNVYPDLLGGSRVVSNRNSPTVLLSRRGMHNRHLLVVVSRQDRESWGSSRRFLQFARYFPGVDHLVFLTGGHNTHDYGAYVQSSLEWLRSVGPL